MTIFFVGIVQYLCAWLRLSQYTRLLPQSTLIGFVNGLAIVIFMSQMPAFQKCVAPDADQYPFGECADADLKFLTFAETELWFILLIFVSCALIIQLFPKVPVVGKYVPSTFIALLFGTVLEHAIIRPAGFSTRTLEQTAPLAGGWPTWYAGKLSQTCIHFFFFYFLTITMLCCVSVQELPSGVRRVVNVGPDYDLLRVQRGRGHHRVHHDRAGHGRDARHQVRHPSQSHRYNLLCAPQLLIRNTFFYFPGYLMRW
jgi:hypothetical protein